MDIRFGATCFFNSPDEFSLVVKVARKYPFIRYVEFRGERPFLFPDITPKKEVRYFKDILRQAGLKNTLHTTMYDINLATLNPWLKDANIVCYKKYLDLAEYLESEVIVVHGGQISNDFVHSPLRDNFLDLAENHLCESLTELTDYGHKKGVKVALENSPPRKNETRIVCEPDTQIKILKRIDHPNLGALLDIAHAFLFKLDIVDYLQKIKSHLFEIHAHNNFGESDDHLGLAKGRIDYKPLLEHDEIRVVPFIMEIRSYDEVISTLEWLKELEF